MNFIIRSIKGLRTRLAAAGVVKYKKPNSPIPSANQIPKSHSHTHSHTHTHRDVSVCEKNIL